MLLQFPDLSILTLSLTTGTIPDAVAIGRAQVAFAADNSVWVKSDEKLAKDSLAQLKSWNVQSRRSTKRAGAEFADVICWPQIVPLHARTLEISDSTAVLFELKRDTDLPEIVNEILRQGNDRQSFRYVSSNNHSHVLLRVVGPPYYSLLRALEVRGKDNPRAFVERKSRVWVEAGFEHPLEGRLKPAAGQHLLLQSPATWRTMKEKPFRDIYSVLEFALPEQIEQLTDTEYKTSLEVPIRLRRTTSSEAPEVYVLTNNALEQLEQFVESAHEDVVRRLSFAVVQPEDNADAAPVVVLRVRPGRDAAPVLVFDGLACRRYLKIPNLFVPQSVRLQPLRRDAVKQLLAADDTQLVWLQPDPEDAERFVPRRVPEAAFVPLYPGWINYVVDQAPEQMTAWKSAHQFDFDELICKENKPAAKKKAKKKKAPAAPRLQQDDEATPEESASSLKKLVRRFRRDATTAPDNAKRQHLEKQLEQLESAFLKLDAPLEAPEREPMWHEMAMVNSMLERFTDASVCLQHSFWEQQTPPDDSDNTSASATAEDWFESEVASAREAKSTELPNVKNEVTSAKIAKLLKTSAPSPFLVSQFAAWVTHQGTTAAGRKKLRPLTGEALAFLQKHESYLSIRATWLANFTLAKIANDVLALARTRDRMLQRLFSQGLAADRDLPGFLRTTGAVGSARFRAVREKVTGLHQAVRVWSDRNLQLASKRTAGYIDLIFSFAYARLGESTALDRTLGRAEKTLRERPDIVHRWLYNAFRYRIDQALSGQATDTPFSKAMLLELDDIQKLERYKVDRLRQHSSILEPHEQLDPYRNWQLSSENELKHELSALFDEFDHEKLTARLKQLFNRDLPADEQAQLITTALEISPRLGEHYALDVLAHVVPVEKSISDPLLRAGLLEKSLQIAANYDRSEFIQPILQRMNALLDSQSNADVKTLDALESLMSQSFRVLRKLGMRGEITQLMDRLTNIIRKNQSDNSSPEHLRLLLQLAGNWFYFGDDRGWADVDRVREVLLGSSFKQEGHVGAKKRTDLAIAYIRAVGEAPLEEAVARLHDLFENLDGIRDSGTYNTHYSLKQLNIVDALGRTIVSDSFVMNKASQRWLDDEEYLIRRRIHRDLRAMMNE